MKSLNTYLFVLILLLSGCTSKEHLIFNNVPIDGHLDKFAGKLTKLGFTLTDAAKKNEIILTGEFLHKECKIHLMGTQNNLAYKVIVELPREVPDSLQNSFEKIQTLYASKYGIGESRYQQYRNPERLLFNEPSLKREIRQGDFTKYTTDSGSVKVVVQDGYISITYLDKWNYEIRKKEIEEENKKEL